MNQATSLQSLFARLTERAMAHSEIPGFDANMRMALRAQSQCRATLETLAAIKSPPIIHARQANVTTRPQQANNHAEAPAHLREKQIPPSKLLETHDGERLDTRTAGAAGRENQDLEAVETIHRVANDGGQG